MRNTVQQTTTILIGVVLPSLSWHAYEMFYMSRCDAKLGCFGGFQFVSFFLLVCGALAVFGNLVVLFVLSRVTKVLANIGLLVSLLFAFGLMGFLSLQLLSNFNSTVSMIISWLLASGFVGALLNGIALKFNKARLE